MSKMRSVALTKSDNEDFENTEKEKIRKELSSLSFEQLLKVKEKIGAKAYNETIFGPKDKHNKKEFKRANKNRPREMSSKIRPTRTQAVNNASAPAPKIIPRDPRFDPLCGTFDKKIFKANYKFVNNIRMKEKNQLEKDLKETNDPDKKKKMKLVVQRLENQMREENRLEKEKQKEQEEKKEIREKFKMGEKPVFKKKSEKKLESLIEKYEDLKKSNKLTKHIEKRTKKLAQRERKKMKD